jgi:alkylation response protein AidB-like acyl-CoA dehydrogenase
VERGLSRMTLPEEWGGYGMPLQEYLKVLERAAGFHSAVRTFAHGMNVLWRPLARFGTEEQKRRWLPAVREGRWLALATTDGPATSGRDLPASAVLDGGAWVVSGVAQVAFGVDAEVHHVLCATGTAEDGSREWSCILVPRGTPGMTLTPAEGPGCHGPAQVRVRLEGCRVPAENLLGRRGDGVEVLTGDLVDASRLGIATSCLGIAQRSFELTCDLARERATAGAPGSQREGIPAHIGAMATELYSLRSAIQEAAARFDDGECVVAESAICELLGAGVAGRLTDRALRVHRGVGYAHTHRVERLHRDARAMPLHDGTEELQKRTISRAYVGIET